MIQKNIRKALDLVNCERLFDQKDINAQVLAFNENILNVFRNQVPNKYIIVDDKHPTWMKLTIKSKITAKKYTLENNIQKGRFESDFVCLENFIIELKKLISSIKALHYENLAKKIIVMIRCGRQKPIGEFSRYFITTKNPTNSTSFDRQQICD